MKRPPLYPQQPELRTLLSSLLCVVQPAHPPTVLFCLATSWLPITCKTTNSLSPGLLNSLPIPHAPQFQILFLLSAAFTLLPTPHICLETPLLMSYSSNQMSPSLRGHPKPCKPDHSPLLSTSKLSARKDTAHL